MSLIDLIRRGDRMGRALNDLQAEMSEAVDESMALDGFPEEDDAAGEELSEAPAEPERDQAGPRLTAHAQSRLAALGSFEKMHRETQENLQQMDARLADVLASQQLTRRFFNVLETDIQRANELELANLALTVDQKRLTEQLADATRRLMERESVLMVLRSREAGLVQDNEAVRAALAAARLELVEAAAAASRNESQLGETIKELSAQTLELERRTHENEMLRERQVSLSLELDKALKREAEAQRKQDELASIHANDSARHSELLAALARSEKEAVRLQMGLESAQLKQDELAEKSLILQAEREAEEARAAAESRGLRSEIQALNARLEFAMKERGDTAEQIARMKVELSDAMAEKHVAVEKLAALMAEAENDKLNLSAASANISQLALQQETEQIQLDIHRQECEDLRGEIATLNARIKELLPFERLYKVTQARQRSAGGPPAEAAMPAPKPHNSGRRSMTNRARAG